jgi:hypothetical protein
MPVISELAPASASAARPVLLDRWRGESPLQLPDESGDVEGLDVLQLMQAVGFAHSEK